MGKSAKGMDALKAALAERQAKASKIIADTGQKWVKRSVLEQQRVDAYMEDKRQAEERVQADEEVRLEQYVEHIARNRKPEVKDPGADDQVVLDEALLDDDNADPPVGVSEVADTLREMGQPITLFGEMPMVRYRRLRLLQKEASEGRCHPDEILLDQVHMGQQQALTDAHALAEGGGGGGAGPADEKDDDEEDDENAAMHGGEDEDKGDSEDEVEDKGDSEDEAEVPSKIVPNDDVQMKDQTPVEDEDLWGGKEINADLMDRCDKIRAWARKAIKAWEKELTDRPDDEKLRPAHKLEMNQHRQCRRDVKPLQKRLRVYALEKFMLDRIYQIVDEADRREYRQATEYYLDLTIGKAAWPVGIGCGGSMLMEDAIGLHDKFNRNDQVKDIAWALNDEVARKYVQALKRLINVAQRHWPPDDVSKKCT